MDVRRSNRNGYIPLGSTSHPAPPASPVNSNASPRSGHVHSGFPNTQRSAPPGGSLPPRRLENLHSPLVSAAPSPQGKYPAPSPPTYEEQGLAGPARLAGLHHGHDIHAAERLSYQPVPLNHPCKIVSPMIADYVGEQAGVGRSARWGNIETEVIYLRNEQDRAKYKVTVDKNTGLLYQHNRRTGQLELLDTRGATNLMNDDAGIVVMNSKGQMYLSKYPKPGVFQHSSFFAGGQVAFAGELQVINGKPVWGCGSSGHYKCDDLQLNQFMRQLHSQGVKPFQLDEF